MRDIPAGKTLTYHELAKYAGSADAVRAAGQACARNPLPLFTPCHRVLASDGGLGGFSSGLAWKRHLLRVEAAR
ncbi:MAG: MGMT family protein [Kiritimatiellae bacterium]|nr:MGMT family protein [Kiritimatiellia bacterium]